MFEFYNLGINFLIDLNNLEETLNKIIVYNSYGSDVDIFAAYYDFR